MSAENITAIYAGIDEWGRATFRDPNGTYYCIAGRLFREAPEQHQIDGQSVYLKGSHFESEPNYPVSSVSLKVEA